MVIRHVGDKPIPLFGKQILPRETRKINPKQWPQVQEQYPGRFEVVSGEPVAEGETETEVEVEGTDAARRLAEDAGIDLADVAATLAPGKQVTKPDVEAYLREQST
jgi:pyruvate/2-oxoglutarate dehydrogenase complex dihydrolipoamide acyltransferase (E2) component